MNIGLLCACMPASVPLLRKLPAPPTSFSLASLKSWFYSLAGSRGSSNLSVGSDGVERADAGTKKGRGWGKKAPRLSYLELGTRMEGGSKGAMMLEAKRAAGMQTVREERWEDEEKGKRMGRSDPMAWGEERCALCDATVNGNGCLPCDCDPKIIYRKEPGAPVSALGLFSIQGHSDIHWREAIELFNRLSAEDREEWEEKARLDCQRYEKEKTEYNGILRLDDEILTDEEAEKDCECETDLMDMRRERQRRRCEQTWVRYRRGHPAFNKSVMPSAESVGPGNFPRFLELPQEIRDRIYRHYFNDRGICRELRQWQLEYECYKVDRDVVFIDLKPLDTRILAINHQAHAEALDFLYSYRKHCFVVNMSEASILPSFVRHSTGIEAPRPTSRIKQWHIYISFTDLRQVKRMTAQLQQLRNVMEQCNNIERVKFTWVTVPRHWHEVQGLEEPYGEMLEVFKSLRGVGRVEFTEHLENRKDGRFVRGWDNVRLADSRVNNAVREAMTSPR
ncbi:MAG: hypothetical protein Q9212_007409 [Teloschistes hypoglaucus]